MNEHLTDWDMQHYAEIDRVTSENVDFVAWVNCHVFECERCKELLDKVCEQTEPVATNKDVSR